MTLVAEWRGSSRPTDFTSTLLHALPPRILGGAALVCFASVCAFAICAQFDGGSPSARPEASAPRGDRMVAARGDRLQRLAAAAPSAATASFDQRFTGARRDLDLGAIAIPPLDQVATPAPTQLEHHFAMHSPAPAHGPATRLRGGWHPDDARSDEQAVGNPDKGIFTKLFGRPHPSIFTKLFGQQPSSDVKLAYASTEGGVADGGGITSGLFDRQTAVYDISAHMVYLPDGRKLEAHSGLGSLLDDPDSGRTKMRGVTPPDIYDLKPREALFHGVAALRLLPEDESKVFGRAGLLAHSFMLGPNGQSNGCVSFRDYDAFRKAYDNHEITRLAVVARID